MTTLIIENSDGIVTRINPVGLKKFATIVDTPERVVLSRSKSEIKVQLLTSVNREKSRQIEIIRASFKVGIVSGRIIEISSGTVEQMEEAIKHMDTRLQIVEAIGVENNRKSKNLDASIALLSKIEL
ncbi:MAG: hypothetical protein J5621_06855 [Paludibacteraceae bacterium]|nr:hypothetical protein [Paludibacteraceae bacterium]